MGYVEFANMHKTDSKIPYMEQNGERIYFRAPNEIFQNSQCLFVEYTDIIRSPYFIFLMLMMQHPNNFSKYFNLDIFDGYGIEELSEWYIHRKYQNPLMEIMMPEVQEKMKESDLNEFMNNELKLHEDLVKLSPLLNFGNAILTVPDNIIKSTVIWYPYENTVIEDDVIETFGDKVRFVTGDLMDALETVPSDATYVFSDITNIDLLFEKHKLYLSSVIIPKEYGYNYIDEERLKIDVDEYQKDVLFKLDFFNASLEEADLE